MTAPWPGATKRVRLSELHKGDYFVTCITSRSGVVARRVIAKEGIDVELIDPDEEKRLHMHVLVDVYTSPREARSA